MSLAGVWKNAYGSTMSLSLVNPNLVTGNYKSSTGSTGTYEVIGYQTSADPSSQAGQAAALAIDWHSVVAGPPDNSWHWVSGLSGQLSIQNGVEQLVLAHSLVASIDFPGLAAAGTYLDKLIYQRVSTTPIQERVPAPAEGHGAAVADPLVGSWFAVDGTARVQRYTRRPRGRRGKRREADEPRGDGLHDGLTDERDHRGHADRHRPRAASLIGQPALGT